MRVETLRLMDGALSAAIHHASPHRHIICCHGLHSSKDSRKHRQLAARAQEAGVTATRFDFRGCGESHGEMKESTLSRRMEELQEVILYLRERFDRPRLALFGSSFGGMTAIMMAARGDIDALAVMSTPHAITRDLGLGAVFMRDLERHHVLAAVARAPPILILQGTQDELVPVEQARQLYARAPGPKRLLLFDTDHSFTHQQERERALDAALAWCIHHLS